MSVQIIPPSSLFRFAFPVRYVKELEKFRGKKLPFDESHRLADVAAIEGVTSTIEVRAGWSEAGIGLVYRYWVPGNEDGSESRFDAGDRIRLWFDTRNTQTVHRATKFCFEYNVYPFAPKSSDKLPRVVSVPIDRAAGSPNEVRIESIKVAFEREQNGYQIDLYFPKEALPGYKPEDQPQIGFFYDIIDKQRSVQGLTLTGEFPYQRDPSLWQTLDLVKST